MKGTTLVRINQETLIAAMQDYFDARLCDTVQRVVRVLYGSDAKWITTVDLIDNCVVELSSKTEAAPLPEEPKR